MQKAPGLIVGRFQPFHKGHLEAILQIVRERGSVKIGIGSAQYSHTQDNPYTSWEREKMIHAALKGIVPEEQYTIYHIPDIHNYPKYVDHVKIIVGEFSALYTNNPVNEDLFSAAGYKVVKHDLVKGISATKIRESITAQSDEWKDMVPEPVVSLVTKE